MSNRDSYVCHPLNISPTKQSHSFSKSVRFQHSQRMYPIDHLEPQKQYTNYHQHFPRGRLVLAMAKNNN